MQNREKLYRTHTALIYFQGCYLATEQKPILKKNSIYFHLFYQHKAGQAKKMNSYYVSSSIDSNSFAVLKKSSYQEHTQLVLFSL